MKQIMVSMLMLLGVLPIYAASAHNEHGSTPPAPSQISQHPSTSRDADASFSKTLKISNCWIRSLPAPIPSAGYFVIKNTGSHSATLTRLAIAEYGSVMLHRSTSQDGINRMTMAHAISIAAGGELEFEPGSYHAMLEKPIRTLAVGSHVEAKFTFDSGETALATCEIKAANTVSG